MKITKNILMMVFGMSFLSAQAQWIDIPQDAKPGTRWWWPGSAVDGEGLDYNLKEFAKAGIGCVEITPIYGVQGNESHEFDFLDSNWLSILDYVINKGYLLGIKVDMATGTGWPFGGPQVPLEQAACKAIFQSYDIDSSRQSLDITCKDTKQKKKPELSRVMLFSSGKSPINLTSDIYYDEGKTMIDIPAADDLSSKRQVVVLYIGKTQQMVKRAAPGGEGYVIDHFDKKAVNDYLQRFSIRFRLSKSKIPHSFFNDSYEVYGADWTPTLLDEFKTRRGYALEDFFHLFLLPDSERTDESKRIMSDYRETLGELLLENFTTQWTTWAHRQKSTTRNQAHGSPANLIDIYSAVDIPECEGFGLTDFGIKGLRKDEGLTRKNFSDISMLKYASSAAHISGKKLTSSETFTWLTEHFRTSLSQCKPDLDLMFLSGVNNVFFHGSCYSPKYEKWPGWRFYASVDMTPYNPWWEAMPAFSKYIERCQSFLQWGTPDNDFLVYLPYYDMIYDQSGRLVLFDIHSMEVRAPKFINSVLTIRNNGYDVDYVSDLHLLDVDLGTNKSLLMPGGASYSAIIIPEVEFMPLATMQKLLELAKGGCKVVFIGDIPDKVPGKGRVESGEQEQMDSLLKGALPFDKASNYAEALSRCNGKKEAMVMQQGLQYIRRKNNHGYHYFISNLQGEDIDSWVELGVDCSNVVLYNPMTGEVGQAKTRGGRKVRLQLKSGESIIVRTCNTLSGTMAEYKYHEAVTDSIPLKNWELSFPFFSAQPETITKTYKMEEATAWTNLNDHILNTTMATGDYSTIVKLKKQKGKRYILDAGDVREWVRVVINGQEVATLFAVPFQCDITDYIKNGKNHIELFVTNLPANRIAEMDRQGVEWRKFKEINVVDLNYKNTKYDGWATVPSGLNSNPVIFVES